MDADKAPDSDKQLVERVQKGDKRAFDMLVLKYQYKVHGIVSRYINDFDEVNDVVQDAFIKAYRALGNFRGESQFYTWLYRIAVNTAKKLPCLQKSAPPLPAMSTLKRPSFIQAVTVSRMSIVQRICCFATSWKRSSTMLFSLCPKI